jgi:hypothetical protein
MYVMCMCNEKRGGEGERGGEAVEKERKGKTGWEIGPKPKRNERK